MSWEDTAFKLAIGTMILIAAALIPFAFWCSYLTDTRMTAACAARGMQVQSGTVYHSRNDIETFYLCRDKDGRVFSVNG